MGQRELQRQQAFRCRILCCASTPCLSSGGAAVYDAINAAIKEGDLDADVQAVSTGCMGPCSRGPMVTVQTRDAADAVYEHVTPEAARAIVQHHCQQQGDVGKHLLPSDIPFFVKQQKVVLANSGLIDPERLEDYVAHGGYAALAYALREMTPEEVCREIIDSGLRGRGGAGYPTGLKWDMVRKSHGDKKYIVANGDEGDPGAYMDRTLMESDPHRVLEGMAIAGYAV
ncbi:MAG: NAD(P)H-dependent oxidoreductase subunit E, partial [Caldilineaceae bacterium]|nr:NAD(P)H-dependent oxidoreductase subunit E [Caldilineaceae bacterium]